ncbi:glycosyltransferase family 4 protein [Candidatus Curtissbacteria bacterium]|nr:glycosyltransferase family 4 protein [Candidatus Curtissbacteria bacterium]
MKKIALFSFYSGVVDRGVETFAYEISKRLALNNHVTIICAGKIPPQKYKVKTIKTWANQPKSSKGITGKFYLDLQSIKIAIFTIRALRYLSREKYDIVIPLNGGWQVVILKVFSKLLKYKMLVSGHAGIGTDDAWNLLWRPDVFVALTTAQASWAKRLTHEVKLEKIPNGVDLHRFNPKIKPESIPLPKPIVVCASALVPYKKVDLTIRAVAKAGNLSLLILGDGELKGSIDSLGKRLLGKRYLRLTVPYSKISGYYKGADVFTLASQTEAFGISYVEAMACNLPVVTTKDTSRAEIVGEAGILVSTTNLNRYSKALKFAVKKDFKNKPYAQSLKFSWNNVGDAYENLINSLSQK